MDFCFLVLKVYVEEKKLLVIKCQGGKRNCEGVKDVAFQYYSAENRN